MSKISDLLKNPIVFGTAFSLAFVLGFALGYLISKTTSNSTVVDDDDSDSLGTSFWFILGGSLLIAIIVGVIIFLYWQRKQRIDNSLSDSIVSRRNSVGSFRTIPDLESNTGSKVKFDTS